MKFYIDAVHKYRVDDQKLPRDTNAFVSEQAAMHMREADVIGDPQGKGAEGRVHDGADPAGPSAGAA